MTPRIARPGVVLQHRISIAALGLFAAAMFFAQPSGAQAPANPPQGYAGSDTCLACHTDKGDSLKGTAHAQAKNPRSPAAGLGCESCHGPGEKTSPFKKDNKEYKWADLAKLGAVHPDENNCKSCHNEKSPSFVEFKFSEKIGKDTHEIMKMKADHACDHKHAEGK